MFWLTYLEEKIEEGRYVAIIYWVRELNQLIDYGLDRQIEEQGTSDLFKIQKQEIPRK